MFIGERYKLETDSNNLILLHKSVQKKAGTVHWKVIGYFYDFRELLKFIADNEIKGVGLNDLKEVAEKQDGIYKLIQSLKSITPKDIKEATCQPKPGEHFIIDGIPYLYVKAGYDIKVGGTECQVKT